MEILHVILTAIGSIILLFILTKLMGNKQMSQLSLFDYINGITIGSIAAEMATSLENDFLKPMTAMIIYALLSIGISYAACKSIKMRKFLVGKPLILYDNGKIFERNLAKAKLDINEFLTQCRNAGYFNLANIQTVVWETNGKMSILPLSNQRPATPCDLHLSPPQEKMLANVIIDGKVMDGNLEQIGKNAIWLKKQLQAQGISRPEEVCLATCDDQDNLSVYIKRPAPPKGG